MCFSLELTSVLFVYSLSILDGIFRMGVQPIARFVSAWFITNTGPCPRWYLNP